MKDRRTVIKQVLNDFLGDEVNDVNEDYMLGMVLDEDEIEILTSALDEALEKENEDKN